MTTTLTQGATANEQVEFARDSIQANNLKFHKRYSFVIAFLVVTQIALAINYDEVKKIIESIVITTEATKVQTNQKPRVNNSDKVKHI